LKDYTEVLGKPEIERENIIGIMRGAYDGSAERNYGQGVVRKYTSKFTFLSGVTKAIFSHDATAMGERCLRYIMDTTGLDMDKQQAAAMNYSIFGSTKMEAVKQRVAYFLSKQYDFSPENLESLKPDWFTERIIALARLVAIVRTGVSRHENFHRNAGNPIYDPESEDPKRLTVQLQKMALSLSLLEGAKQVTQEVYKTVKRVGIDTMYGRQYVILRNLMNSSKAMRVEDLEKYIKLDREGIKHYLEDMELLGLIQRKSLPGSAAYFPSVIISDLWSKACL
jgi:DNA-binding HxlR family transcriptional regulator